MGNEVKRPLFSYELVHDMFVIMCKQDIMFNSTIIVLVLFVAFVCAMNGIDCLVKDRVGLAIINLVMILVNFANAFSCMRRIRKTKRDIKDEQRLYDEMLNLCCSDEKTEL